MDKIQEIPRYSDTSFGILSKLQRIAWIVVVSIYLSVLCILLLFTITTKYVPDQYYFQASSWLHGSNAIDAINSQKNLLDVAYYKGHTYLPLAPMSAVIVLPYAALLGEQYRQWMVVLPLVGLTAVAAWRILGRLDVTYRSTRYWLLSLFFLGTVYFSNILRPGAWYIAHVVTCWFLFLGIDEALGKRRPWLLGLYLGFAAASRFTALFVFPFFLVILAVNSSSALVTDFGAAQKLHFEIVRAVARRYILFGLGLALPMTLYFGFNYARFGNVTETGYGFSEIGYEALIEARSYGLFSPVHIPKNLYYFLLAMPVPNGESPTGDPADSPILTFPYIKPSPWGLSIFLTTPAIIYVIKSNRRAALVKACWAGILVCAIPIFCYYGVGFIQFGFRYALDFTPFLWILIVLALREKWIVSHRPSLAFWLIVAGIAVNFWGIFWALEILKF